MMNSQSDLRSDWEFIIELFSELDDELPIGFAFRNAGELRRYVIHVCRMRPLYVQMEPRIVALQIRRCREHHVSKLGGRRHKNVLHREQVQALQRLNDLFSIWISGCYVRADGDKAAHGVRFV